MKYVIILIGAINKQTNREDNMTKKNKNEIEFLKYQEHCYNTLNNLLDDGWNKYKFDMPPEFVLSLIFVNSILRHPNLKSDGKEEWLKSYKKIFKELPDDVEGALKKLFPQNNQETVELVKKTVLN